MAMVPADETKAALEARSMRRAFIRVSIVAPLLIFGGLLTGHSIALWFGIACALLGVVYYSTWRRRRRQLSDPDAQSRLHDETARRKVMMFRGASLACTASAIFYAIAELPSMVLRLFLIAAFVVLAVDFWVRASGARGANPPENVE